MKLSELFLNRFLYREAQSIETKDSIYESSVVTPPDIVPLAAGSAAQDINTGNVFIDGAQIDPGTIPAQTLDVANWGWGQTCAFTSASATQVNWGAGSFKSASGVIYTISAGNTGTMGAKTYIYLDLNVSSTAYQVTTTPANAVGVGKVLIAVAQNAAVTATYMLSEATQIVGDNIIANTINASKITAGTITATQISGSYVYAGTIVASQITTGTLTGIVIQTQSTGQRVVLTSTLAQFFNSSNVEIVDTYASGASYLIKGQQSTSGIILDAGVSGSVAFKINTNTMVEVFDGYVSMPSDLYIAGLINYKSINQPVIYNGYVSGTSITLTNTSFTAANPTTGNYTITHNLGTTGYSVVVTAVRAIASGAYSAKITQLNSNDFRVGIFDDTGTSQAGDFMFILVENT